MTYQPDQPDQALKAFVRAEIDRALHPGMVDGHTSRSIRITDPDGTEWRGFVWPVTRDDPLPDEKEQLL